jgi:hypothetical protein
VEPRLVVRALCPTEPGDCAPLVEEAPFLERFERELERPLAPPPPPGPARRAVRDRRGEGFAGVAGDLLSSGERVAIVCADVARRRAGLELVVGGVVRAVSGGDAAAECPALVSWDELLAEPELVRSASHLIALDPPIVTEAVKVAAAAPAGGLVHLAWGEPEADFALAAARAELDLRPVVTALYRALREHEGGPLEPALLATGAGPRACARAVRVLTDLGLAELERSGGELTCRLLPVRRADLEQSETYRHCQERLRHAEARLASALPRAA